LLIGGISACTALSARHYARSLESPSQTMTDPSLAEAGRRRVEAMERASQSYDAIRDSLGDYGIANAIYGITQSGSLDLSE